MKNNLNSFSHHPNYKIAESLNHDFLSLPVISPELANELETLYYKSKGENREDVSKEYYLSIDRKNNRLLTEMLEVLKHIKNEGKIMSEKNIRTLLDGKMEGITDLYFWLILRIAIYELGYM